MYKKTCKKIIEIYREKPYCISGSGRDDEKT